MAEHVDVPFLLSRSAPEVYTRLSMAEEAATSLASHYAAASSSSAGSHQEENQQQLLTSSGVLLGFAIFSPYLLILLSYFALIFYLVNRVLTRSILRWHSDKTVGKNKAQIVGVHSTTAQQKAKEAAQQLSAVASNDNDGDRQIVALKMRQQRFRICLYTALAILSLGTTWWHMLHYMSWSYSNYLHGAKLSAIPVPSLSQDCSSPFASIPCALSTLSTTLQRMHLWLRDTSLFKEAWLTVVGDEFNWWWSAEICAFTVGTWSLMLKDYGRRYSVPLVWAFMLIGQLVAISFAQNLFHLALLFSPSTDRLDQENDSDNSQLLVKEALESLHEVERHALNDDDSPSTKNAEKDNDPDRISAAETDVTVVESATHIEERRHTVRVIRRSVPKPSLVRAIDFVPTTILVAAGMVAVWMVPNTLSGILVMHLFPLFLSFAPSSTNGNGMLGSTVALAKSKWRSFFERLIPLSILERFAPFMQPSFHYALVALSSASVRVHNTARAVGALVATVHDLKGYGGFQPGWRVFVRALWPTTFYSHPAQSSISWDNVCVTLSSAVYMLDDAFLHFRRIWKHECYVRPYGNRKWRSFAYFAVVVSAILPACITLGPAATLAAYLAVKELAYEKRLRQAERQVLEAAVASNGGQQKAGGASASTHQEAAKGGRLIVGETIEDIVIVQKSKPGHESHKQK